MSLRDKILATMVAGAISVGAAAGCSSMTVDDVQGDQPADAASNENPASNTDNSNTSGNSNANSSNTNSDDPSGWYDTITVNQYIQFDSADSMQRAYTMMRQEFGSASNIDAGDIATYFMSLAGNDGRATDDELAAKVGSYNTLNVLVDGDFEQVPKAELPGGLTVIDGTKLQYTSGIKVKRGQGMDVAYTMLNNLDDEDKDRLLSTLRQHSPDMFKQGALEISDIATFHNAMRTYSHNN